MALVLPLILTFILGIYEYGRYLMTAQLFDNAAREGVRYAIAHVQPVVLGGTTYGNSNTDITNIINSVTPGITLSAQNVQIYASDDSGNNVGTWTSAQPGQSVTVKITGNYQVGVMTLLCLPSTLPITAQATMNIESN